MFFCEGWDFENWKKEKNRDKNFPLKNNAIFTGAKGDQLEHAGRVCSTKFFKKFCTKNDCKTFPVTLQCSAALFLEFTRKFVSNPILVNFGKLYLLN